MFVPGSLIFLLLINKIINTFNFHKDLEERCRHFGTILHGIPLFSIELDCQMWREQVVVKDVQAYILLLS